MQTSALLMMLASNLLITGVTLYYFWRVLKTGAGPDSVEGDDLDYPRGG